MSSWHGVPIFVILDDFKSDDHVEADHEYGHSVDDIKSTCAYSHPM